ncbi:G-protein coupled receptor 87-like [Polypterus senegalus]|uniref:G-protein coupled receptor 87-like n=1 Tax=Polypterus senegalus TaxID=55291 RepID=UPI0019642888|nr:G-protein coupled receptor 87-like [Polypterus senegalus]XP_039613884.1 G-protein coupled receptor 87-like [Polypterus senegalus]XP_039613890.1 G-protein coupled receptor 87-like [Polypterus senegalus]XP_039613895.1 G-protein coupled receptor 87-like [Polypterus senegalus]
MVSNSSDQKADKTVPVTIALCTLFSIIFITSLILNSMAAWIFFNINKNTSFIFYLKNTVIADLIMTMTFPFKIASELSPEWSVIKQIDCRYSAVIFYINMYVSILFLGLISIDRYMKIVKPFKNSRLNSVHFTRIVSAGVWVTMGLLSLPNMILTNQSPEENFTECSKLKSDFGKRWHAAVSYINILIFLLVFFVLVGCYLSICRYIKNTEKQFVSNRDMERKSNQNICTVLLVFFICFVPYHMCRIPFTLKQIQNDFDDNKNAILNDAKKITLFISACNVCLDPIIYLLMCKSFKTLLVQKLNLQHCSTFNRVTTSPSRPQVRRFREYSPTGQ